MKNPVHVIAHTHWDRAWYWPFERFRLKLIECVKAVVRDLKAYPDYRFNFDGQTLMLEDYLQVCPEDRSFLQQCAVEGRIKIGPMFCLSDVYCTGGEALIRNLLLGRKWCEAFGGGYSRVLHMPDTFGIIPEIPMLAAGFGFSAFSFMRGVAGQVPGLVTMEALQGIDPQIPADTRWFHWDTPDGSRITTLRLRQGYASAAYGGFLERATGEINFERYVGRLQEAVAEWNRPAHDVILLMAGVDHQIPWSRQAQAQALATTRSDYEFRFSSLDSVADALAATSGSDWPVCANQEFHGNGAASVLGGTLSSRIYLKQANAAIEQLLVHQCEPAAALALLLGQNDPAFAALDHAWRTLLVTHPHDDICGCSVDSVHRRNESDMEQAAQSADALRRRALFCLVKEFGGADATDHRPTFIALNFQGRPRLGPARLTFDYEGQRAWGDIKPADHYRIVDETGAEVPYREISRGPSIEHPRNAIKLELYVELPAARLKRFYLEETSPPPSVSPGCVPAGRTSVIAENEHLLVVLHRNGSFDLTRKDICKTFRHLGRFSDQADIGDTYDFSDIPGQDETLFTALDCSLQTKTWPGGVTELTARGELILPASVNSVTRVASAETVALPFKQTLVLAPDARQIEISLSFTNTAADHRLRWNIDLPFLAESSLTGLKFMTLRRPVGRQPDGNKPPRIFPEHPMDHFVAAAGLAVLGDFPRNYEVVSTPVAPQRLAITICRSVSYLTNPTEGATRPGTHAGPHTLVPEARCLGRTFEQRLALRPFTDSEENDLLSQAALWRAQPFVGQVDATMHCPPRPDKALAATTFFTVNEPVLISACKPASHGAGVVLRLHNPTAEPVVARLQHRFGRLAHAVLLDETTPDSATVLNQQTDLILLDLPPFALRTLGFPF
ncbi:MAG: alpha-mannosidase [Rariglobus sp.]|jgi:alpha-mannosidase/mannosylglycerate hydrolase|nr:alpha-mannosidase [Rariglobus sp.]